jgi:hypothetical protein
MQMHLASSGLIAIDDVFGDFLGSKRVLTSLWYLFPHMAYGGNGDNDFSHVDIVCFLNTPQK